MIFAAFEFKCVKHPAYTGQRAPVVRRGAARECFQCAILYELRSLITRHAKPYTIQHAPMFNERVKDV